MADPVTWAVVIGAGAGVVGAYTSYEAGQTQSGIYEDAAAASQAAAAYNADVTMQSAAYNAALTETVSSYNAAMEMESAIYEFYINKNNALIALNNAQLAENSAQVAREYALFQVDRSRERNRRVLGSQAAQYGKAGVVVEGTPVDVAYDSMMQAEYEAAIIRYSGDVDAYNYYKEAVNQEYAAAMSTYQANLALRTGLRQSQVTRILGEAQAEVIMAEGVANATSIQLSGQANAAYYSGMADLSVQSGVAGLISGIGSVATSLTPYLASPTVKPKR